MSATPVPVYAGLCKLIEARPSFAVHHSSIVRHPSAAVSGNSIQQLQAGSYVVSSARPESIVHIAQEASHTQARACLEGAACRARGLRMEWRSRHAQYMSAASQPGMRKDRPPTAVADDRIKCGVQVLRLQASMQASQAQLTSQSADLDCKDALIINLRSDIASACSQIEALSQAIPVQPQDIQDFAASAQPEEPDARRRSSAARKILISLPLCLLKGSLKIGAVAAGTLLAERAYMQHQQEQEWQQSAGDCKQK